MEVDASNLNPQKVPQTVPVTVPGGRFKRWVAIILDSFFLGLVQLPLVFISQLLILRRISFEEADLNAILKYPVVIVVAILIVGLYKIGFLVKYEATPGKRWSKLKVIQYNGERIGLLKASVREIIKIMYYIPLLGTLPHIASIVLVLFSRERRALHDLIAGTLVIKA